MAFPAVEATSNIIAGVANGGSTAATTHTVRMPATVSSGALLIIVGRATVAGAVSISTGIGTWTIVQDSSDASDDVTFWAYLPTLAAGTEASTDVTVTHGSGKLAAIALSVTGAVAPGTQAPQTSTVAVGTGSNPGPTAATPTGGAKDYLWIAWHGADGEHTVPPATIPASYGNSVGCHTGTAGAVGTNCGVATADRQLNASSEDAGTWTTSVAVATGWTSYTIAVHPAPVVAPIPDVNMAPLRGR